MFTRISEKVIDSEYAVEIVQQELSTESQKFFVIDNPPPFSSGQFHPGHIFQYSLSKVIQNIEEKINNKKIHRLNGYDVYGLPTVLKVAKLTEFKSPTFKKSCEQYTDNCIFQMQNTFKEFGLDTPKVWRTSDTKHYELVKEFIFKAKEKELLVVKDALQQYCIHCKTFLAHSQITTKLVSKDKYLLNWLCVELPQVRIQTMTTKPEFVRFAEGLFYNPLDYRYAFLEGNSFYLQGRPEIILKLYASTMVHQKVGTGVVYVARYGSRADYQLICSQNLNTANYLDENDMIEGQEFDAFSQKEIAQLIRDGSCIKEGVTLSPIQYHTQRSSCGNQVHHKKDLNVYIITSKLKEKIIEVVDNLCIIPDKYIADFKVWINGLGDWCISRQYKYGSDLYGILSELGLTVSPNTVCDCWVDSAVSYYRVFKEVNVWPQLRIQGYQIMRTWLLYTIVASIILDKPLKYEKVFITNLLLGANKKKLSKSNTEVKIMDLLRNYSLPEIRLGNCYLYSKQDTVFEITKYDYAKYILNKIKNLLVLLETIPYIPSSVTTDLDSKSKYNLLIQQLKEYNLTYLEKASQQIVYISKNIKKGATVQDIIYIRKICDIFYQILQ